MMGLHAHLAYMWITPNWVELQTLQKVELGSSMTWIVEKWSVINKMKISKDKFKVMYLGWKNCMNKYRPGNDWLDWSTAETGLRVTLAHRMNMSHQANGELLLQKKPTPYWVV